MIDNNRLIRTASGKIGKIKLILIILLFFGHPIQFFSTLSAESLFEGTKDLPTAYQGRFRSVDAASRLWLYDMYHRQQLKKRDMPSFNTDDNSALELLWRIHFLGHQRWDNAPFFWVHYATVKTVLKLDTTADRFSFNKLSHALDNHNGNFKEKEIEQLQQQLHLFSEFQGSKNSFQLAYEDFYTQLQKAGVSSNEIAQLLEGRFSFIQRLQASGTTLRMLPAKFTPGEWVSLHAFNIKNYDHKQQRLILSNNFTSFSNKHFDLLRDAYFTLQDAVLAESSREIITLAADHFAEQYKMAYQALAGTPYRLARGKALTYPSELHLQLETLYYRLPLIEAALLAYAFALILVMFRSLRPTSYLTAVLTGFAFNTAVLIFRCWILQRPPVSNMFETVVYVPWVAVAIGLIYYAATRSRLILTAAVTVSFALLILLKLTQVDPKLENVQAVLDSQYWLIIHVLMIVGSYGAFAVCGILGHFYLIDSAIKEKTTPASEKIAQGILHTMYAGVALLIPGTILGGVWAAESWGRFWDWDPKESWAFISACVYVLFIHAYLFHYIRDFGLAVGAVAGLVAVSFTWYGVNYVLGTGLHSYGFGSGGTFFYFLYVASECLFIFLMVLWHVSKKMRLEKN